MKYPQMAKVFPDFNQGTLPEIPADWEDISWGNDACPCFAVCNDVRVYIDYLNPSDRENPETTSRFEAIDDNADTETERLLFTDDWNTVLAWAAARKDNTK